LIEFTGAEQARQWWKSPDMRRQRPSTNSSAMASFVLNLGQAEQLHARMPERVGTIVEKISL
jgi:hypothetical protein